jgi:hypothetical protein
VHHSLLEEEGARVVGPATMPTTTTTTTTTTSSAGTTTTTTTTTTAAAAAAVSTPTAEEAVPPASASDRCLVNTFGGTINTFPRMSADFDAAWLSAALNAPVESFEMRYAGEGQTALTFVLHTIKYGAGAKEGLPSSVAIKIHAESETQRAASADILLYDKEIYFYTKLLESVPVTTPKPLAIWTDGADATGSPIECFALMMEDMSIEHDVFDATCLNPERTMSLDQIRAANKQQLAIHDRFWNSPLVDVYPLTIPGKGLLNTMRSGLPDLEGQWEKFRSENVFFAPFNANNGRFTKTGSGQT